MKNETKPFIVCDMCGSEIKNKKCLCGTWTDVDHLKDSPMKLALEDFHTQKRFVLTGDAPHLGCAIVLFRGDYKDCKAVEKFIYKRKGRPYYDER